MWFQIFFFLFVFFKKRVNLVLKNVFLIKKKKKKKKKIEIKNKNFKIKKKKKKATWN